MEGYKSIYSDVKPPCGALGFPKPIPASKKRSSPGGFGIRNFLTLFLSIEVSKATKARAEAEAAGKMDLARPEMPETAGD